MQKNIILYFIYLLGFAAAAGDWNSMVYLPFSGVTFILTSILLFLKFYYSYIPLFTFKPPFAAAKLFSLIA